MIGKLSKKNVCTISVEETFGNEFLEMIEKIQETLLLEINKVIVLYGPFGNGQRIILDELHKKNDITFILLESINKNKIDNYLDNRDNRLVFCLSDKYKLMDDEDFESFFRYLLKKIRNNDFVSIIIEVHDYSHIQKFCQSIPLYAFLVKELSLNQKLCLIKRYLSTNINENELIQFARSLQGYSYEDICMLINIASDRNEEISIVTLNLVKNECPLKRSGVQHQYRPVYWKDIGGYEDVKEKLQRLIQIRLKNDLKPLKGVLLSGPPGCSKTMFASALATECELNLFIINSTEIFSKYVGESEQKLKQILIDAQAASPSMIFIDEVDYLFPGRKTESNEVTKKLLNELLLFMDGIERKNDTIVLFVFATNHQDNLDEALIRPGRIDEKIIFGYPDFAARSLILKISQDKFLIGLSKSGFDELILKEIIEMMDGLSGAAIVSCVEKVSNNYFYPIPSNIDMNQFYSYLKYEVEEMKKSDVTNDEKPIISNCERIGELKQEIWKEYLEIGGLNRYDEKSLKLYYHMFYEKIKDFMTKDDFKRLIKNKDELFNFLPLSEFNI